MYLISQLHQGPRDAEAGIFMDLYTVAPGCWPGTDVRELFYQRNCF